MDEWKPDVLAYQVFIRISNKCLGLYCQYYTVLMHKYVSSRERTLITVKTVIIISVAYRMFNFVYIVLDIVLHVCILLVLLAKVLCLLNVYVGGLRPQLAFDRPCTGSQRPLWHAAIVYLILPHSLFWSRTLS